MRGPRFLSAACVDGPAQHWVGPEREGLFVRGRWLQHRPTAVSDYQASWETLSWLGLPALCRDGALGRGVMLGEAGAEGGGSWRGQDQLSWAQLTTRGLCLPGSPWHRCARQGGSVCGGSFSG